MRIQLAVQSAFGFLLLGLSLGSTSAQDCLFADDFDAGNSGIWRVTNAEAVRFVDGMVRLDFQSISTHSEWAILERCVYKNFKLVVEARSNAPTLGKIVVFRTSGSVADFNGYGLNVRGAPLNDVVLIRRTAPFTDEVLAVVPHSSSVGEWIQIAVRMVGAHIEVWVDDQLVIDLVDASPLESGWMGLAVNAGGSGIGRVDFDNFAIEPIGTAVSSWVSSWGRVKSLY